MKGKSPTPRRLFVFEKRYWKRGLKKVAGVDEAGRGPIAGPVVAAAVVLNEEYPECRFDDSKRLTYSQREEAFSYIVRRYDVGIGIVGEQEIDLINILNATLLAMKRAVRSLRDIPEIVLVDGRTDLECGYPSRSIVKGDSRSASIAAASIVAKVTRDRIMDVYDTVFPFYGFASHKGYGTKKHLTILRKLGPCSAHRFSFRPLS